MCQQKRICWFCRKASFQQVFMIVFFMLQYFETADTLLLLEH